MNVSRITIGRLFNLGSYEHVRYEIAVDLAEGDSAETAIVGIERILKVLGEKDPLREDYGWHNLRVRVLHWTDQDWWKSEGKEKWEKAKAEAKADYDKKMAEHTDWRERQEEARKLLDDLGGARIYKDAKLDWEFEDQDDV